ncbi:hypothetical protein CIRG_00261 [Coccidioides immitis RMSCC 2394]|uniref:Secreted protein n=1 Tax=Coccidioides immitis RMSCC 2394 TaxID=404692 RepID=A0A0J6Y0P3_COCIT|nr:hypothetical protein CIRG_00261 [Coccidioides immitis RMSCC 2394]
MAKGKAAMPSCGWLCFTVVAFRRSKATTTEAFWTLVTLRPAHCLCNRRNGQGKRPGSEERQSEAQPPKLRLARHSLRSQLAAIHGVAWLVETQDTPSRDH